MTRNEQGQADEYDEQIIHGCNLWSIGDKKPASKLNIGNHCLMTKDDSLERNYRKQQRIKIKTSQGTSRLSLSSNSNREQSDLPLTFPLRLIIFMAHDPRNKSRYTRLPFAGKPPPRKPEPLIPLNHYPEELQPPTWVRHYFYWMEWRCCIEHISLLFPIRSEALKG